MWCCGIDEKAQMYANVCIGGKWQFNYPQKHRSCRKSCDRLECTLVLLELFCSWLYSIWIGCKSFLALLLLQWAGRALRSPTGRKTSSGWELSVKAICSSIQFEAGYHIVDILVTRYRSKCRQKTCVFKARDEAWYFYTVAKILFMKTGYRVV